MCPYSFVLVSVDASAPVVSRGCAVPMPITYGGENVVVSLLLLRGAFRLTLREGGGLFCHLFDFVQNGVGLRIETGFQLVAVFSL